jgi:hypothetical protein
MPHSAIEQYMGKLEKHRAVLNLMMGEAAKLPHMDDDSRREWANEINEKLINGKHHVKSAPLAIYKLVGIGVRK